MKQAADLMPWQVTELAVRPYEHLWSFNPSLHFDGQQWRCVVRCCDYALPGGKTIRSKTARPTGQQTKNALVILDPATWRPIEVFRMEERDGYPRAATPHVGFEDMRLFWTDAGGLQGIAASLHLRRPAHPVAGASSHQPPEQVLLSFDAAYHIVEARPIRGSGWSGPQKNWVPFDGATAPRFLYSISKGSLFDAAGPSAVPVQASLGAAPRSSDPAPTPIPPVTPPVTPRAAPAQVEPSAKRAVPRAARGADVRVARGTRLVLDAGSSRSPVGTRSAAPRAGSDALRVLGTGRALLPKYAGLRGGTQLVRVGADAWLGVGHSMKFVEGRKYYWHVWYTVTSSGKLTATSEPVKLAPEGIEFAAGLAIDGDRVVVSFGVDDMTCRLGETRLAAVLEVLHAPAD